MESLDDLALFVAVAQSGSFSAAAEKLEMSVSTLSRRVAQLEQRLDVQLLKRNTRNLRLTDMGEQYADQCAPLLAELKQRAQQLHNQNDELAGTIRITMPHFLGLEVVSEWLIQFSAKYPDIHLHVSFDNDIVDLLQKQIDIALRIGPLSDSQFIAQHLIKSDMGLYASPAWLKANPCITHPEDLSSLPGLFFRTQPTTWELQHLVTGAVEYTHPKIRISEGEGVFVAKAAINGLGVVGLPNFYAHQYVQAGSLKRILSDYQLLPVRDVYMVYPSRQFVNARTRLLMQFIKQQFKQLSIAQSVN